jgi:hypothetical protein
LTAEKSSFAKIISVTSTSVRYSGKRFALAEEFLFHWGLAVPCDNIGTIREECRSFSMQFALGPAEYVSATQRKER